MPLPTPKLKFHDENKPCISSSESGTCSKVQDQTLVLPKPTSSPHFTHTRTHSYIQPNHHGTYTTLLNNLLPDQPDMQRIVCQTFAAFTALCQPQPQYRPAKKHVVDRTLTNHLGGDTIKSSAVPLHAKLHGNAI